jgi:hypothetical protein
MVRYIFKSYGHRALALGAKDALTKLVDAGVPNEYAIKLLSIAESRCRLLATLREMRNGTGSPFPRTTIDGELSVEWLGNAPAQDVHEIVQTPEGARDLADTGQFAMMIDAQLEDGTDDEDTATRLVLDGNA